MENNSNKRRKLSETVTLVLKEERFEVQKQKLMDKSLYFAALWSADYREYNQTEHTINYDISSILLQDFIDWIHHYKIFTSTTRSDEKELHRLLNLLDLSVLFAADKLIEDVTDRIERHFIPPKYAIDMWILTQELNVKVLRDLSLAVCLDRFSELPLDSIYDLSREDFLKLIGNINIRATESYLVDITREWNNRYHVTILYIIPGGFRSIEGMQITARRYDLYLCGGKHHIRTRFIQDILFEVFNKNVWRYSLISKKWILETVMPVERSEMITVFLKDKLYLVGGVGRDRQELRTIDIYDIYTGLWTSSGTEIPCTFTSVPEHFIFNDKLIIHEYQPTYYIYLPDMDVWETKSLRLFSPDIPILTLKHMSCYIDFTRLPKIVFRAITETCNVKNCNKDIININTLLNSNSVKKKSEIDIYHNPHVRQIFSEHNDGHFFVSIKFFYFFDFAREFKSNIKLVLYSDLDLVERNQTLHLHSITIPRQEVPKFRSLFFASDNLLIRRFFNLLHPAHLHTTNLDHI
ncbi:uncharacterized protein [Temnothorax nylanderi]|uniref:uncharacterized protein n=1 Tax=Temnothorax nylanderi TaxID=102681 RepID=UPI003A83B5D4